MRGALVASHHLTPGKGCPPHSVQRLSGPRRSPHAFSRLRRSNTSYGPHSCVNDACWQRDALPGRLPPRASLLRGPASSPGCPPSRGPENFPRWQARFCRYGRSGSRGSPFWRRASHSVRPLRASHTGRSMRAVVRSLGKMTKPVPSAQQSWRAVHSAGESRRQLIKPHT